MVENEHIYDIESAPVDKMHRVCLINKNSVSCVKKLSGPRTSRGINNNSLVSFAHFWNSVH